MTHPAELVAEARRAGATDLHLVPGQPPAIRVGGLLRRLSQDPASELDVEAVLEDLCRGTGSQYLLDAVSGASGSVELSAESPLAGRVRVSAYRATGKLCLAIRLCPGAPPTPQEIGCPDALLAACAARSGLVVVSGPTGAGKTTTVASLVQHVARTRNVHVLTVEDPVEYVISPGPALVTQRQVGTDVRSFSDGLREALRQDADVMVIGECRDPDTAASAALAAQTGHLVITTVHAQGTVDALSRVLGLLDRASVSGTRQLLADVLLCLSFQVLLRRRRPRPGPPELSAMAAAYEVLVASGVQAVQSVLREGRFQDLAGIMREHRSSGMVTLADSVSALVSSGEAEQTY